MTEVGHVPGFVTWPAGPSIKSTLMSVFTDCSIFISLGCNHFSAFHHFTILRVDRPAAKSLIIGSVIITQRMIEWCLIQNDWFNPFFVFPVMFAQMLQSATNQQSHSWREHLKRTNQTKLNFSVGGVGVITGTRCHTYHMQSVSFATTFLLTFVSPNAY